MRFKKYITEAKKVSASVIMTDGDKFLIVHATGKENKWETPKGEIDPNENSKQAAIREFYEETGIKIDIKGLRPIGKFNLHKDKDVILYTYRTDKLPPTSSMRCLSYFYNKNGSWIPETNKWKYITLDQIDEVRPEMRNMIKRALE